MFSMCSELAPRAPVPDNRIPQLMQPWLLLLLEGTGMRDEWMLTGETWETLGCLLVLNGALLGLYGQLHWRPCYHHAALKTQRQRVSGMNAHIGWVLMSQKYIVWMCGRRKQAMKVAAYPITAMYLMNWLWYDYSFITSGFKYLI